MTTTRCQTPVPTGSSGTTTNVDGRYLPTDTHQLTPYASPISEKRCVDSAWFFSSASSPPSLDNDNNKISVTPAMVCESPVRCYMPIRRVSCSSLLLDGLDDGDVTPPLHPKPTVQIVSPSVLSWELLRTDERRYQCSKRKRAAEGLQAGSLAKTSLQSLLRRSMKTEQAFELPMLPMLPDLSMTLEEDCSPAKKKKRVSRSPSQQELQECVGFNDNIPMMPDLSLP